MDKEALLGELALKVRSGEITREEVMSVLPGEQAPSGVKRHFSVTKMLYVLGAAIAVTGVVIFIYQIWEDLASLGRITVTLGLGILFALIGSMLLKQKPEENIGAIFHFIGGMLIPGGAMVAIHEFNGSVALWPATMAFGIIFVFYLVLSLAHRNPILTFFAIGNGTAFVYLLFEILIDGPFYQHGDLYAYLTMAVGLSYLLLAFSFRETWNRHLVEALHFFGSGGFLGAAFSQVIDSALWQILYVFFITAGLALAVYMKSSRILIITTLFLLGFVSYITNEYFAHSIGWPISLVILGFVFIGLGYASIAINRKYIRNS